MRRLFGLMLGVGLFGCAEPTSNVDAGAGADAGFDAGAEPGVDAGSDAGAPDAGFDAGPDLRCPPRDAGVPDQGVLRVIAANLSSGNFQSWTPGEGARILRGLKPDVALMQEWNINGNTEPDRRAFVDATFGADFCFHIQSGRGIPNGVVSRWPILDAGQWADPQVGDRAFAWAQIDVPGPRDLWAVSIHLLTTGSMRPAEAQALVASINQFVPPADLLVIGGDLNTTNRTEAALTTLSQIVRTAGPYPVDALGNENTNAGRTEPYDWVMADPELDALEVPVRVGDAGFDAGLVFDSRRFTPLSDLPPILATDSAAPSMQHMAVVKDYLLP